MWHLEQNGNNNSDNNKYKYNYKNNNNIIEYEDMCQVSELYRAHLSTLIIRKIIVKRKIIIMLMARNQTI
jgi:hypothetical protein